MNTSLLRTYAPLLILAIGLNPPAAYAQAPDGSRPQAVKVYKNSGARQCRVPDVSLERMARELTDNRVNVKSSGCAVDGLARITVCEADAGLYYVFEIDAKDLQKAGSLGFAEIGKISGYGERPCPAPNTLP